MCEFKSSFESSVNPRFFTFDLLWCASLPSLLIMFCLWSSVPITVIPGLYSALIHRPHLLIFKRKKKLYINKPHLSLSRRCPRDCGQASRHSRLCGQISRHGNSTAPIILTFTVNTSKPPRMGRWGPESSVRGTTSGFHSSLHSVSLSFALSMSLSSRGKSALELALSSSSRRVYTGRWSAVLRRATLRCEAPRYAAPWSDRFGVKSIFSARRERIAPGNTLKMSSMAVSTTAHYFECLVCLTVRSSRIEYTRSTRMEY